MAKKIQKSETNSKSIESLEKLLAFYKRRYTNQNEMEKKFNDAAKDLIESGDIEKLDYVSFCADNDVDPITFLEETKKTKKTKSSSNSYYTDGCGGGGYTRSSC